ncbi:hypothetical protein HMPREF0083_04418, partial [Aneurinibacillus aneurinilyticus ATCC 12856]
LPQKFIDLSNQMYISLLLRLSLLYRKIQKWKKIYMLTQKSKPT